MFGLFKKKKTYLIKWKGGISDKEKVNETISTGTDKSFAVSRFLQIYNPKMYGVEIMDIKEVEIL